MHETPAVHGAVSGASGRSAGRGPLFRRTGFVAIACALIACSTVAAAGATAPNGKPWSFLIMLADDIGAKELACYGSTEHRTPHLDRLAAEGVRFRTGFVTPICSPTRVLVMTGRYGTRTGWYHLMGRPGSPVVANPAYDLGTAEFTFADLVKTKGYATVLAGKWQLTGKIPTLIHDCGFDEYRIWAYKQNLPEGVAHLGAWEGAPGGKTARYWHPCIVENGKYLPTSATDYGPDLYSDFLIDFMRRHVDRPFLAYYPMALTHGPHDPVPDPENPGKKRPAGFKNNVEYLDHIVGKMAGAVDDLGLAENTVIFFVGDNGTGGDGKATVTELGARVPFIVRCPGTVQAGVVSDELVSGADIFPTIAALSGAHASEDHPIDGRNLLPTLRDPSVPHRDWLFSYLGAGRILRDKRWLLEGDGRFYDCGEARDGLAHYKDVTDSADPEAQAARRRFDKILEDLPAPAGLPDSETRAKKTRKKKEKR